MYHVFHALQVMFYLGNFDYFSDSAQPNWFGLVSAEIYVDDAQLLLLLVVTNVIAESWITLMLFWPNNFVTIYKVHSNKLCRFNYTFTRRVTATKYLVFSPTG